jgi:hypothetical protein
MLNTRRPLCLAIMVPSLLRPPDLLFGGTYHLHMVPPPVV